MKIPAGRPITMMRDDYKNLAGPKEKSNFKKNLGWTAYIIFGLFSTFVAACLAGAWVTLAWICMLVAAPKLWEF